MRSSFASSAAVQAAVAFEQSMRELSCSAHHPSSSDRIASISSRWSAEPLPPCNSGNLSNALIRLVAPLRNLRVHDLKHTYGRRLRAAGVSFEDRQDLLGHKSTRITTHYSASELANLIAASEKALEKSPTKLPQTNGSFGRDSASETVPRQPLSLPPPRQAGWAADHAGGQGGHDVLLRLRCRWRFVTGGACDFPVSSQFPELLDEPLEELWR